MVASWSSVMLGNSGSQCIGHIQGVSVEGRGSWAIIHQLTIHMDFRTASCDIKPLKCLACFAHRPSMFSGQGKKKFKAFRQRTVSIPCKWLQCIEVNANKKIDSKPLASTTECNGIQILLLPLHSTFKRNSLNIYCKSITH